ncbi:hypothetical protein [Labrys wisconsinensis]|uniref:Uncharacterized membrane protein YhaH (DUF805 family) n=1 Tax=Labrys wisconsinensis TaxID=425677 RepID=A0ABU0J603_9HYPH|nr:hypothetical protein [Labrys wisconsinensis]MDQ0468991.1 uncharacterized membrane protein YhaH (DUF805 family) [Labrys wisconsinensis]
MSQPEPVSPFPPSRIERILRIAFWAFNAVMAVVLIDLLLGVQWPALDDMSGDAFDGIVAVGFSLAMFLVIWLAGALCLGLLARHLRRRHLDARDPTRPPGAQHSR